MLEAINMVQEMTGREFNWIYSESSRLGDHMWWVSDISRFEAHYPDWQFEHKISDIMQAVIDGQAQRLGT
jgi:CDP-paratose 2-epimerase